MSEKPTPTGASALTSLHEGLLIAFDAMHANAIRSGLTILGVAVGVSVVVALAALITGIRSSVMEAFEAGGPNNFVVMRFDFTAVRLSDAGNNRPPWWNKPELLPAEAEVLERLPTVEAAMFTFPFSIDMDYDGHTVRNIQTSGYSAGWPAYTPGDFVAGRDFTPAEVDQNRAITVISEELATELFGERDPIGRRVRMLNRWRGTQEPFRVVGVFAQSDNIFSGLIQHFAIVGVSLGRLGPLDRRSQRLGITVGHRHNLAAGHLVPDHVQPVPEIAPARVTDHADAVLVSHSIILPCVP